MNKNENTLAVVKPDAGGQMSAITGVDMQALIGKAVEQGSAMEVIKELAAMEEKIALRRSRAAFDAAMSAFQSECPVIAKSKPVMNKGGGSVRYHYAPLDSILNQVQPILDKHGFSYKFTTVTTGSRVKVICEVKCAGHSETSEFESPIDPQAFMNEQQKFAAALTYAKRYAFCNAFGILTGDEDADGETDKPKPPGPGASATPGHSAAQANDVTELRKELWTLLTPVRGAAKDWMGVNNWLWREEILDGAVPEEAQKLSAERLAAVIEKAREKLGNRN